MRLRHTATRNRDDGTSCERATARQVPAATMRARMEATIPLYPLVVVPIAAAIVLFWRRARWHLAVLRSGQAP